MFLKDAFKTCFQLLACRNLSHATMEKACRNKGHFLRAEDSGRQCLVVCKKVSSLLDTDWRNLDVSAWVKHCPKA